MRRRPHPSRPATQPLDVDRFYVELNAAFARLRRNTTTWSQELEERRAWDETLMDGQDPGEGQLRG